MLHVQTKYHRSRPYGFRQEDFFYVSPYLNLCTACDPWGVAIYGPRGLNWTNMVEVHKMMLHTKYQGSRPCGFRQENLFMFLPKNTYVKPVTLMRGHFWPQGYNLNKLGRGSLYYTTYQKSRLYALLFQTWFFHVAPYKSLCKICDPPTPPVRVIFGPRAIIWTNLVQVYKMILHTKYQGSRSCGFRQEDFFQVAPYISLCKTCDPRDGVIFSPRAIIWTSLEEVH